MWCVNKQEQTIWYCKKQIKVSFSCVWPVIDNEFHHNIVKVICGSTWQLDNVTVMTKFIINNRRETWKTDVNLLINKSLLAGHVVFQWCYLWLHTLDQEIVRFSWCVRVTNIGAVIFACVSQKTFSQTDSSRQGNDHQEVNLVFSFSQSTGFWPEETTEDKVCWWRRTGVRHGRIAERIFPHDCWSCLWSW